MLNAPLFGVISKYTALISKVCRLHQVFKPRLWQSEGFHYFSQCLIIIKTKKLIEKKKKTLLKVACAHHHSYISSALCLTPQVDAQTRDYRSPQPVADGEVSPEGTSQVLHPLVRS